MTMHAIDLQTGACNIDRCRSTQIWHDNNCAMFQRATHNDILIPQIFNRATTHPVIYHW